MLKKDENVPAVKEYINWYIAHLNYSDKYELTGTIYDYDIHYDGKEISLESYDSVDGYAATFLILIYQYFLKTKDKRLVNENKKKLYDIAYLLIYLQDQDGLVKAMPNDDGKFLMDNSEAFAGLDAFIKLAELKGWSENLDYYKEAQNNIKLGILNYLYDEQAKNFYWAMDSEGTGKYKSDWDKFYPDALSQIFPILYGVVDKDSDIGKYLLEEFNKRYKGYKDNVSLDIEQKILLKTVEEEFLK
ncbi:MAG: hypothetical protein QXU67_04045 [Candidatus Bathyarchaeia archaeon]